MTPPPLSLDSALSLGMVPLRKAGCGRSRSTVDHRKFMRCETGNVHSQKPGKFRADGILVLFDDKKILSLNQQEDQTWLGDPGNGRHCLGRLKSGVELDLG